jgi:Immunity protein 35
LREASRVLSVEETREIAERELREAAGPEELILVPDFEPVVRAWAVVWAYNSRRFLLEDDLTAALAGNGPMVVDRRDGSVRYLPSYAGIDVTLPELERELGVSEPE